MYINNYIGLAYSNSDRRKKGVMLSESLAVLLTSSTWCSWNGGQVEWSRSTLQSFKSWIELVRFFQIPYSDVIILQYRTLNIFGFLQNEIYNMFTSKINKTYTIVWILNSDFQLHEIPIRQQKQTNQHYFQQEVFIAISITRHGWMTLTWCLLLHLIFLPCQVIDVPGSTACRSGICQQ